MPFLPALLLLVATYPASAGLQRQPAYSPLISPASIRRRLKRRASSPPAQL
jgi:hypothetical protein